MKIELTERECKALFGLIEEFSGGNAENVFSWDGSDTLDCPIHSACQKVYCLAGRSDCVPDKLLK